MGWATYMTAWAASEAGAVHPLIYANAVVMAGGGTDRGAPLLEKIP